VTIIATVKAPKSAAATTPANTKTVNVPELRTQTITFPIRGLQPGLIVNQLHEDTNAKKFTDQEQFERSLYNLDPPRGGCKYGVPVSAFKNAMVDAAGFIPGNKVTKVMVRGAIYVIPPSADSLIALVASEPRVDKRKARNKQKNAIDVVRAHFEHWSAELTITFSEDLFNEEGIARLVNLAGYSVGVGCMRPACAGGHPYGRFELAR